jgi:cell division protease FtsH
MDEQLGHVAYERERSPVLGMTVQASRAREFSDETERLIDHAVRDLTAKAFAKAHEILEAHRDLHEKTAETLLRKETLEAQDLEALRAQIASSEGTEPEPGRPAMVVAPDPAQGELANLAVTRAKAKE